MKKIVLAIVVIAVAAIAWWIYKIRTTPPTVPFTKVVRQKISNNLSTNGKVEPQDYQEVRATVQGLIARLPVHQGDTIAQGQVLAEISQPGQQDELQSAEARAA